MIEHFTLRPRAPFRLDYTVWTLRRRSQNIIDQWDGQTYQRLIPLAGKVLLVSVQQKNITSSTIQVALHRSITPQEKRLLIKILKRMLGLSIDLSSFYRLAQQDKYIKDLVQKFKGAKPPRYASLFEAFCNAVACQQVSLEVGIQLINRLAENYGAKLTVKGKQYYAFPTPEQIKAVAPSSLKQLGFSLRKGEYVVAFAKLLHEQQETLEHNFTKMSEPEILNELITLKGIGRWSAEYILLRGLGRLSIFPGDDVGAQKNLQKFLGKNAQLDYEGVSNITQHWDPFAGLIYFHLLLKNIFKVDI